MTMCNQYMFIFNSKYSSYSLWDGVRRGRLRWLDPSPWGQPRQVLVYRRNGRVLLR